MKPETGGESTRNEMAQEEFDPLDLMSGVAMLVLEARTPDNSVKGRVEGPHCPSFKKGGRHMCSKGTLECFRALEFRERIDLMWKNGIPSCIDILLFPACSHGQDEARSLEGVSSAHVQENSILLERWSVQCIQKWHGEWIEGVSGSMLLQAVRSYLYFSQLSSWLASMHGCLPITIAYRLYAPGEEAGVDFAQPPDSHAFPTGIYGPHGLKVHVLALPRQEHVPALLCALGGDQEQVESGLDVAGACGERSVAEDDVEDVGQMGDSWPSRCRAIDYHLDKSQPAEYDGRQSKTFDLQNSCEFSNASTYHHIAVARDPAEATQLCGEPPTVTVTEAGALAGGANVKGQRSSSRDRLEGQLRPLELSVARSGSAQPLDLHSPKVLMSAEAQVPNALVTKKQHIDFRHSDGRQTDDRYPTLDSMEEKLFLARHFRDLPSPLSPLDIQNFLANLQSLSGPIPQHLNLAASLADEILARKTNRALEDGKQEDLDGEDLGFNPVHAATGTGGCMHKGVKPRDKGSHSLTKKQLSALQDSPMPMAKLKEGKHSQKSELSADIGNADACNLLSKSKLPWKGGKSQFQRNAALANLLLKSHDSTGLKKKDLIAAAQQWSESFGDGHREDGDVGHKTDRATEPQAIKKRRALGLGDFDERVTPGHLSDVGLSRSIDQTLRDINKIVRARKTKSIDHEFPEVQPSSSALSMGAVVSSSWSSSSSSSSSSSLTCSSSPRVLRGLLDDGDRNSGSSTPTNRCTPPLSQHSQDLSPQRRKSDSTTTSKLTLTEITETVTPDNRQNFTSERKSDSNGHVPASNVSDAGPCPFESDLTPEAVNGALPDGPAKRRLSFNVATNPVLFSEEYMDSISQRHVETTDRSEWPDTSNAKSRNIPPSWNLLSLRREVLALEEESTGLPQSSQDFCEEQCATPSEQYSPSSTSESCDQTKSTPDPLSLCKFYIENSLSSSPSLTSFTNGAAYTQSLSEQTKYSVNDDSLIHNWQQTSVETLNNDQSNSKLYYRPDKSAQQCPSDSVKTLDSLRDGPSPCESNAIHRNGFSADDAATNSVHKSRNLATVPYHNGAVQNNKDTSDDDDYNGGGFDDQEEAYHDKKRHVPMRAKSAPNFFNMSTKNRVPRETENGSTDGFTRGRLTTREKPQLEMVKGAGPQERLRHRLVKSASMMFSSRSGLPSQSSPAPIKRRSTGRFDYDETLTSTKAIKSALSMPRLPHVSQYSTDGKSESGRILSTSAPASTNSLLGNFEESILNGRIEPAGVVDGFTVDVGASGSFCPRHLSLPVTAYFFHLSDDNAPSPYLGHISLDEISKKGYHIPRKGTLQVTLFNPNKTVVKMFVVMYDLVDMPPDSQTVIRQRTVYMPVEPNSDEPSYLRYLIHLRVASSSSGKIYLHTDIRLIFARNKFELDSGVAKYELRSFTETPVNPKYSPKR